MKRPETDDGPLTVDGELADPHDDELLVYEYPTRTGYVRFLVDGRIVEESWTGYSREIDDTDVERPNGVVEIEGPPLEGHTSETDPAGASPKIMIALTALAAAIAFWVFLL